jgi:hypothetical protein
MALARGKETKIIVLNSKAEAIFIHVSWRLLPSGGE